MSISKNNKQLVLAKDKERNRLDFSKLKFSGRYLSTEEALRDVEPYLTLDERIQYREELSQKDDELIESMLEESDWDLITNIFQNAIKRKGLTK